MTLLLLAAACMNMSNDSGDTGMNMDSDADSDTDSDSDTDADTDADADPVCGVRPGDDWAWGGECPGMTTPVTIAVSGCDLTLDYGSGGMTMGMPYSATVTDSTVTFADDNGVAGCVATLDRPDAMTGSCDGGCTFSLER